MEKLNKDIIAFNRRKVLVNNADIISLTEEKIVKEIYYYLHYLMN